MSLPATVATPSSTFQPAGLPSRPTQPLSPFSPSSTIAPSGGFAPRVASLIPATGSAPRAGAATAIQPPTPPSRIPEPNHPNPGPIVDRPRPWFGLIGRCSPPGEARPPIHASQSSEAEGDFEPPPR